jgi:hypothetical protein
VAANQFFTDDQNLADLVSHMPEDDQRRFNAYGHFRVEAVFIDRIFIIYKPTGLTSTGRHRPPEILTTVKVTDFSGNARYGCTATLEDVEHSQQLQVTHVPRRMFNYPIYVSIPPRVLLRWDARRLADDRVWRSLSFALLIKTKNKSSFFSKGNVYAETPIKFKELYPEVNGQFKF